MDLIDNKKNKATAKDKNSNEPKSKIVMQGVVKRNTNLF